MIYVDDILVISNTLESCQELKSNLSKILEITDLGDASQFLGMEISRDRKNKKLWLKQSKYTENLLKKYNKLKLKSCYYTL